MAVTAQSHEVLNNVLALAPAVVVVDILGSLAAPLTGHEAVYPVAEVFKVYGSVVLHGSFPLR